MISTVTIIINQKSIKKKPKNFIKIINFLALSKMKQTK